MNLDWIMPAKDGSGTRVKIWPQRELTYQATRNHEVPDWPLIAWKDFELAGRRARGCDPMQGWHELVESGLEAIESEERRRDGRGDE